MKMCNSIGKLFSKMISILIIIIAIVSPFTVIFNVVEAAVGDEVRASKKVISLVYDNSGSMSTGDGSYATNANYATQALISMLNERDELYISFTSEFDQPNDPNDSFIALSVPSDDIQRSVQVIQQLDHSSGTPAEAIYGARKVFDYPEFSNEEETTQFWFIVMSDGIFSEASGNSFSLQNLLDDYKDDVMSNGSTLNVVYLGMGSSASAVTGDTANNFYTFMANNDTEIVSSVLDIANLISGRLPVTSVKQISDTTVEISCDLAFYSISVLSQQSPATLISAKSSEQDLNVLRNVQIDARSISGGRKNTNMYANSAIVNASDYSGTLTHANAGTYVFEFSEKVDVSNMLFLYEPAITIIAEIWKDGQLVDDTSTLQDHDKVTVKLFPAIPGEGSIIDDAKLPANIDWSIEYYVDGNLVDNAQGRELSGIELTWGDNTIVGTMGIPDYVPLRVEIDFGLAELLPTPTPIPTATPTPTPTPIVYHFGIEEHQKSDIEYDRRELKKGKIDYTEDNTAKFILLNDGEALSVAEQEKIGVTLEIERVEINQPEKMSWYEHLAFKAVDFKLIQNSDGSYTLEPKSMFGVLSALFLKTGTYKIYVRVSLDHNIYSVADVMVISNSADPWDLVWIILLILLILDILQIIFIRKKFDNKEISIRTYQIQRNGKGIPGGTTTIPLRKISLSMLIPFWPYCFKKSKDDDLFYIATGYGQVMITGKSIAKAAYSYGSSSINPDTSAGYIAQTLTNTHENLDVDNGKQRSISVVPDQYLDEGSPFYIKRSERSDSIIRYKLDDL